MKITVKDGDKTLGELTHVVTKSEADNLFAENVDVHLSGASLSELSAKIEPTLLVGDGKAQATITVTVTDSAGKAVTNDTITITPTLGKVGSITNNKNGTYTAVYTAPEITENKTDKITVVSKVLNKNTTLSVTLQATPPKCEVTVALQMVPDKLTADGLSTANITVEVKCDEKPVKDEVVEITVIGMGKVGNVTNHGDGTYTAVYTAPKTSGTDIIKATAKNSGVSKSGDVTLIPGPPASIKVSANPQTLKPDGVSKSTLTAIVKDVNGNPVDDAKVNFSITSGDGSLSAVEHKGKGQHTAVYTAPKADKKSEVVITAEVNKLSDKPGIEKKISIEAELAKRKMEVNISIDITAPEANAGDDKFVKPGATVFLDGSKSTDNTQIAKYSWDFDARNGIGEDATGSEVQTSYVNEGEYVVTLGVSTRGCLCG